MKCFVVNLASSHERMNFMSQQLTRLGLAYERIEAVTANEAALDGNAHYWSTWERSLKDTEKACFLSHQIAWQKIVDIQVPALILEDDALLSSRVPELLSKINDLTDLDHVSLEVRKRIKLVEKQGYTVNPYLKLFRLYQDRSGAAAYILWPSGAAKLLKRSEHEAGLADAIICKAYELISYQVEPACAVQLDCCSSYDIIPPINTCSYIGLGLTFEKSNLFFRLRRIKSQFRMGVRFLRHISHAIRRDIIVNSQDFL